MSSAPIQRALRRLTDLDIVPGTLNVRLPEPFDVKLEAYISQEDFGGVAAGGWVVETVIEGRFRGFLFRGDEQGYPADLVELISDHNLREALGLRDGDEIEFTLVEEATAL